MKKTDSSKPDKDKYKEALQRAAGLCSRQEQCSHHIREKLISWDVIEADASKIIEELQKERFLDDGRYAAFFARDKFRFNSWGKVKIGHMLRAKKIDENVIASALSQIDEDAYYEKCIELLSKKSAGLKDSNPFSRKGKLYRFAAGRGFEPEIIHRALRSLEKT